MNGAPNSFNDLHTDFVTTEDGTTLSELMQVLGSISLTPILVPLLIPWIVPPSFVKEAVSNKDFFMLVKAILEYPVLGVLPIWIVTIFAGDEFDSTGFIKSSGGVLITLLCVVAGILIVNHAITAPKWFGFKYQWEKLKNLPTGWSKSTQGNNDGPPQQKLPFITNYRAIVIYITILCILAVDFPIFPRRFAKTKTYGISLMDVGTGCFVFANGIVAPEARNKLSPLSSSFKSTIPIVILGCIRLISVKGIEYQEVVEEYGVHWNFFFTLAGIKLLSSLLFAFLHCTNGLKLAFFTCLFYELILNYDDFQNNFILNPKIQRSSNLFNANREGIFSVAGYLSIYLTSLYVGKIIMWKNRQTVRDWAEYAIQSLLQVSLFWGLYAIAVTFGNKPCRRTANASYVLLMIALNYSLLWFQMFLTFVQVCLQHFGLIYGPMIFYELTALHSTQANRIQNLQRLRKEFSQEKQQKDNGNGNDVDRKLHQLEQRLCKALDNIKNCQRGTSAELKIREEIAAIENEILAMEEKINVNTSDEETDSARETLKLGKNIVLMPDLSKSPVILEAICYNGLAVFLIGNLLTGLINCMIYTMYTPAYLSFCYLWFYVTVICASSLALYWYQIQLKVW